ncbi:transposable element Tcb1 transposase [Trichonephila clavipes]|nr:transposable element Tcb1 transposase [Trichonephila clavipes]
MVRNAISSRGSGSHIILRGMIPSDHCRSILVDHLHLMLQILNPGQRPVVQEDNASAYSSLCVQTWLHGHDDEVEHQTWSPQYPDLNIIECLWGF